MLLARLARWLNYRKLQAYKDAGLQIADDCIMMSLPNFGSEPYLISIGRQVTIANGVSFITHDGATAVFRNDPKYARVIRYGRITIHDNCFVGIGAILMPGVSIGPNSVVGAGSVVTKDVPPNTVCAGVPAHVLMSVDEYAQRCLALTPEYNEEAYFGQKKEELLRLFPRPW